LINGAFGRGGRPPVPPLSRRQEVDMMSMTSVSRTIACAAVVACLMMLAGRRFDALGEFAMLCGGEILNVMGDGLLALFP
jgi:class 3 adenylate cyclase